MSGPRGRERERLRRGLGVHSLNSSGGIIHWIVRKWGGNAWKPADGFAGTTAKTSSNRAQAVAVSPVDGTVFVVGMAAAKANQPIWTVRRSQDAGETWATVDTCKAESMARGVAIDSENNVYVVGDTSVKGARTWTVRKSTTGNPGTWFTVDTAAYTDTYNFATIARCVTTDRHGTVYVGGYTLIGTGGVRWLVRKCPPGGEWSTIYDRFVAGGSPKSIVADSNDNVFVTGSVSENGSASTWITRKLLKP
ncbi:MAG: SBBP repeat-containing protein [Verrucomicrobiia bacterium]